MCLRVAARRTRTLASAHTQLRPAPRYSTPSRILNQLPTRFPRKASLRHPTFRPIDLRSPPQSLNSSSGSALAAVFAGVIIAGAIYFVAPRKQSSAATAPSESLDHTSTTSVSLTSRKDILDYYYAMTAQVQPGRPGNLTPQQEASLREFWRALLQVFGVFQAPSSPVPNGAAAKAEDTSTEAAKKKKSRLGMFRRKNNEKDSDASSSLSASTTTLTDFSNIDENDKHGVGKEFKLALADQTPEELRESYWNMLKHDNPDAMLLRFLRARKWDVQAALVMMISAMHWRSHDMHVDDDILKNGEEGALKDTEGSDPDKKREGEMFLQQLRMGKSFVHGIDKEGRPMSVVRVRLHRGGEQSEASLEKFTVHIMETARFLLKPPVDTATVIFDMTDFSMANMDYTPVKFMIKCFEANYPESLGIVLIHKAPWIFQGVWSLIKGWLDPVVASKVNFTKNIDELSKFIPLNQAPLELGGEEKWEYKYVEPVPGENALMAKTDERERLLGVRNEIVKKFEEKTLEWIRDETGEDGETLAAKRKGLLEERMKIADELRKNYWHVDPYVRARTFYDRIGVLGQGGKVEYYPERNTIADEKAQEKQTDQSKPEAQQIDEKKVEPPTQALAETSVQDVD